MTTSVCPLHPSMPAHTHVHEPARDVPVCAAVDVLVCGGGPAGTAAALAAARAGATTMLLEAHGCLGGIWTAGSLSWIIDYANKTGLMAELTDAFAQRGYRVRGQQGGYTPCFDAEGVKATLEELCGAAGVRLRLHTRAVAVQCDAQRRVRHVITESKSGREAWAASRFIDCTGDGDVAALAGCGFDLGHPETGALQPMSLIALVGGVRAEDMRPFVSDEGLPWGQPHAALCAAMARAGAPPSYSHPALFRVRDDLFVLMANHQYGVAGINADDVTRATLAARQELQRIAAALRGLGGIWQSFRIIATAEQIGTREGRRIHGLYTVTARDIAEGRRHDDAVCRVTFGVDIHSTDPRRHKGLDNGGVTAQPYDIPLRALIAKDVEGLLLAGRCISGDFWAHGSYRVTGNAVALGEAAGRAAARRCGRH